MKTAYGYRTRNRATFFSAIIISLLLSWALGGSSGLAAEAVEIRAAIVSSTLTNVEKDGLQSLVSDFEKTNPGIKVKLEPFYSANIQKLVLHAATGVAPDIVLAYNDAPITAIDKGLFLPLSPLFERDAMTSTLKDFVPGIIQQVSRNGVVYGLPHYSAIGTVFYNIDMVNNAGIALNPGWNWDDLAKTIRRLTIKENGQVKQAGFEFFPVWTRTFPWYASAGVDFSNPNAIKMDTEAAIKATRFWQDLVKEDTISWRRGDWFRVGRKAAMTTSGAWDLILFRSANFPLGILPMPKGPAGRVTMTNTDIIGIMRDTKHPNEAWTFMKWFYSLDTQSRYLEITGLQPARMSLGRKWMTTQINLYRNANQDLPPGFETFIQDTMIAQPQPFFSNAEVINQIIMPAIEKMIKSQEPIESVLPEMTRSANIFLKGN